VKKVAIASVHWKHNHGSMLQSLALQKALFNMEIDNEIINMNGLHPEIRKNQMPFYMRQMFNSSFIQAKMAKIKFELLYKKRVQDLDSRKQHFNDFESHYVLSQAYKSMREVNQACQNYSHVIVGSDQLWLPINIAGDYYTLNFVPDNIPKISYATSFGVADVPKRDYEKYQQFLKRIQHLSVREESGQALIKKLTGQEAKVTCDPTLLFDENGWETLITRKEVITDAPEKYILCYFLGGNKAHRNFVKTLKQQTGLPIVAMIHMEEYHPIDNHFADYAITNAGPCEFINLIRNADYICTDSFHGTIFSLIHHKKFWVFKRHNDSSAMSTNTRIDSLLGRLNLQNRYLTGSENVEKVLHQEIDYGMINTYLSSHREKSMQFLKSTLGV